MYTKYIKALELMQLVLDTQSSDITWKEQFASDIWHPCHAAWDTLFSYMYDNFEVPKTNKLIMHKTDNVVAETDIAFEIEKCKEILPLKADQLHEALLTIPPEILEIVWPVAMAARLLRTKLPFNHRKLTTFSTFHQRYGFMVLGF